MNETPEVPRPHRNIEVDTWQDTMVRMAARYNDTQLCLDRLDITLAEGHGTPNQIRRLEEDCMRTFGLFVAAMIESYSYGG